MTWGYFSFLECLERDAYLNKLERILLAEFADSNYLQRRIYYKSRKSYLSINNKHIATGTYCTGKFGDKQDLLTLAKRYLTLHY